jgi:hypothetical protein
MTQDELLKKDWQLLTARALISNSSFLRSIFENQAVIISELKKIPIEQVLKQMNEYNNENYNIVSNMVDENIPNYPLIERKY